MLTYADVGTSSSAGAAGDADESAAANRYSVYLPYWYKSKNTDKSAAATRHSVCLLYWNKSTNTDAATCRSGRASSRRYLLPVLSLLALLVQMYKY